MNDPYVTVWLINSPFMVFLPSVSLSLGRLRFPCEAAGSTKKICLIFDEQRLMKGISVCALFMNGEWCINSLNMYMYITWERTSPMACHIDSGVSYEAPARSIWKNIRGWHTKSHKSYVLTASPSWVPGHSWEVAEFELPLLHRIKGGVCTCSRFPAGALCVK